MLLYTLMGLISVLLITLLVLLSAQDRLQKQVLAAKDKHDPMQHDLIQSFGTALVNHEFSVRYQPKICAKTGKMTGVELLVRWDHWKYGSIAPEQFISLAEKSGFIIPLGLWILKQACMQAKLLQKKGYSHIRIAINLSAQQFKIGDIVEDIAGLLAEYEVPATLFEIELTESAFLHHNEKNLLMLKVLREMGIIIALDDFGTGYSSLKYLREFPCDILKIDKTFTRRVLYDDENVNIIKAMISLAKALHMKTIVEGVENEETARFLTDMDVDELQGFYYYLPLTGEELIAVLEKPAPIHRLPFHK